MKEKIAKLINYQSTHYENVGHYCADVILTLIREAIKKRENPYEYGEYGRNHERSAGFEACREAILKELE